MAASNVQSVERALGLLDLLTDGGGVGSVSALADAAGLSLPTAHRLLNTMERCGYVQRYPGRKYALATRTVIVGQTAAGLLKLRALPFLERLVRETGETSNAAALEGRSVAYFAQVPSPHPMRTFIEEGTRVELHASSVGKALLAEIPADRMRDLLLTTDFEAFTPNTITTMEGMRVELEKIRSRGYSIDAGEQDLGIRGIAVRVPSDVIHAAFSITGPEMRMRAIRIDRLSALLREAAAGFAAELEQRS